MNEARRRVLAAAASTVATWSLPRVTAARDPDELIVALAAARSGTRRYKATARRVSISVDGGHTWRDVALQSKPGARIHSISVSAADPAVLYVGGPGLGVIRVGEAVPPSDISRGLPREVTSVAAHATQANAVYAYARGRGIYRSEDAGAKWRLMDAGPRGGITRFVHSDMPGSMQTGWLLVAGPQGVRLSMDCFCGWRAAGELPGPAHAIAYDPTQPSRVVAAAAKGLFESTDAGQDWSPMASPDGVVTALAFAGDGALFASVGSRVLRRAAAHWEAIDA